jgi:hypothetical protein
VLVLPQGEPFVVKNFFADFERHDLGPAFHERDYDGTRRTAFLTEALWASARRLRTATPGAASTSRS